MKRILLAGLFVLCGHLAVAKDMSEDQKTLYSLGNALASKYMKYEFTSKENKSIVLGFSDSLIDEKSTEDAAYQTKLNTLLANKQENVESLVLKVKAGENKSEVKEILYFLGKIQTSKIMKFGFNNNEALYIVMGFSECLAGKKGKVDISYGKKLNAYLSERLKAVVVKQKDAAKPFLDKMAKEKGAEKLPSGVIYIPVKEGTGDTPKATDIVKVHYHGTFPDGKVFDSSVDRGTPAEFPLGEVIPCWTEGVQKIMVGGKAKLVCPSDTAYGDDGASGDIIPGGATLVFEIELLNAEGRIDKLAVQMPSAQAREALARQGREKGGGRLK